MGNVNVKHLFYSKFTLLGTTLIFMLHNNVLLAAPDYNAHIATLLHSPDLQQLNNGLFIHSPPPSLSMDMGGHLKPVLCYALIQHYTGATVETSQL